MLPARRLLAATALTVLWGSSAFAQGSAAPFRVVDLPDMPQTASLCAAERDALLARVRSATAAAAENAQLAARRLAERQIALASGSDTSELDRMRAERDFHAEEWRRAEAVFDAAQRIQARACASTEQAGAKPPTDEEAPPAVAETPIPSPPPSNAPVAPGVGPGPAPTPSVAAPATPARPAPSRAVSTPPPAPVVEAAQQPPAPAQSAAPVASEEQPDRPAVSLAIALEAPRNCAASQACPITVTIENRGGRAFGSPLLASVALGFDGGIVASVTPQEWGCERAAENLTCASTAVSLGPDQSSRFTIEWRMPERLRRPSATVCARIVWPGQQAGGIYRGEQVSALQYALLRAGFETGGVDGRIGPRTAEAIRQLRTRAGLAGAGITPDLVANLFGANGALSGDDNVGNDSACTTVSFDGAPVAAAPPAEAAPPPAAPPLTRRPAPRREVESAPPRRDVEPAPPRRDVERPRPQPRPPVEARRRPAPTYNEEEDDVVIYRNPRPRYYPPGDRGRGTVVYGPNGPVVVYPGDRVRPWGGWPW